uniref:Reverse transcriptase domain-containing protein n=1 Tax=Bombyx mori TaxID=7091 RepID=A0A8R2LWZ6_BOMMO|nr:uncharacterized protein LOC119628825 [Bombyx mori]
MNIIQLRQAIMRQTLENWEGGVRIGGVQITNLRYADDTTLLASSEAEMKELLDRLEAISLNMGLAINKSKTKLLVVDRFSSTQRTDLLAEYEAVDQFVYLGSVITDKGSCEPEIRRRIGMAKTAMTQLSKVWKDPMRTNVCILEELKVTKRLLTTRQERIRSFFGHIMRSPLNSLEKLRILGQIEGKRARGRAPARWVAQLKEMSGGQILGAKQGSCKHNFMLNKEYAVLNYDVSVHTM